MSVKVADRGISDLQFYKTARDIRKRITLMLSRFFSSEVKDPELAHFMKISILKLCTNLMSNICRANAIYPIYFEELVERQILQDKAIGSCEALYQELEFLIDIYPCRINEVADISKSIAHEINLLRRWKKSNNKIKNRLQQNENKVKCKDEG